MDKLWFKKNSGVHGSGLFASQNIKKGSKVIEYVGDKVTKKEGDRRADIQINKAKRNESRDPRQMLQIYEREIKALKRRLTVGNSNGRTSPRRNVE